MADHRQYALLRERLADGPVVTATVVRTKGSTPREVGAQMIVQGDRTWGTIGGGCGEADAIYTAREMLARGAPQRRGVRVDLTERALETSDRICGGIMDVLVELWTDAESLATIPAPGADCLRIVPLGDGETELWSPTSCPESSADEECREIWATRESRVATRTRKGVETECFFERVTTPRTLLICGAGHIAQPLCSMARLLGHRAVVVDDRTEYASEERFPDATEVIALPFADALRSLAIDENTLAVLATRGHRHDELCLRELLRTEVSYIGMIGSRRRVRTIFDDLGREGYAPEQLERVWAPVGLDIGAATPAEIAISVLGEIIAIERGRTADHPHLRKGRARA